MKPDTSIGPAPQQDTSPDHEKATGLQHTGKPYKKLLIEIASVCLVLAVAIYFIFGASAKSPAPASSTPITSTSLSPTAINPTPTTKAGNSFPTNLPKLQILGITQNNSSVKITFKPVRGAKDYRIMDVSEPIIAKYAGMAHLSGGPFLTNADGTLVVPIRQGGNGPSTIDIPYPQIEWNLLEDEQPHTLIVQAVNQLGPVPPGNLYTDNNGYVKQHQGTAITLGMNEGPTPDGHVSINGQGPSTNNPKPIAQSLPIIVQPNPNYHAIPSTSSATQTFFDTFPDSEAASFKQTAKDPEGGTAIYTLNAGTNNAWTIQYKGADIQDSYPMIEGGHFMDVLFDGGTPGTGIPLHVQFGSMSMTPGPTANFSSGRVLHITTEIDLHQDGRRWLGIEVAPANDPLTSHDEEGGSINHSDKALFLDTFSDICTLSLFTGPSAGSGSPPKSDPIWGAIGQADHVCDISNVYTGGGINLDNRGKLDLFISQTHAALFINGKLMVESNIPGGLPFTQAKVYFTHYVYHTGNDINELKQYRPWEKFWINYFHWSDERHWDNMGFEVLPTSVAANSATWQRLVALPNPIAPKYAPSGTGSTGNGNTTNTSPSGSTMAANIPWRSLA
ncbi:MAG TPA: hypothetical protein VH599_11985 [Ktedonobacterales bacterium]|jgi:hypothetical protein